MDYWDIQEKAVQEYRKHWENCLHASEEYRLDPWSNDDLRHDCDMIREDATIEVLNDGNIRINFNMKCQWVDCKWELDVRKYTRNILWENFNVVYGREDDFQ